MKTEKLTKEELEIISYIDTLDIENWAEKEEYWKIYRQIIWATKKYLGKRKILDILYNLLGFYLSIILWLILFYFVIKLV